MCKKITNKEYIYFIIVAIGKIDANNSVGYNYEVNIFFTRNFLRTNYRTIIQLSFNLFFIVSMFRAIYKFVFLLLNARLALQRELR